MSSDAFGTTRTTWIGQKLGEGASAIREINRHLMSIYREPLRIYFRGMSLRGAEDADDLVEGFFADRLGRPSFLRDWQASGLPLRRWLMTAFCFYLQEFRRRTRRDQLLSRGGQPPEDVIDPSPSAEQAMDRAYAVSMVRKALSTTQEQCSELGLTSHWRIFVEHHLDGRSYPALASDLGVAPDRASIMARTVRRRFVQVFTELFEREGITREEVSREIRSLLEVMEP